MIFGKQSPAKRGVIIKKAMAEIEKMLLQLDREGKDLTQIKLRKYQKTHNISCTCSKCLVANQKKDPRLRGLREFGFKVYVSESDSESKYSDADD